MAESQFSLEVSLVWKFMFCKSNKELEFVLQLEKLGFFFTN